MAGDNASLSGLGGRYALALLDLADEKEQLDQVADDLRGLRVLLDESADLRRLVDSPLFTREQQAAAIAAVVERLGVSELTRRFVLVVAQNRRLFALGSMISAYLAELSRRRGEVQAEVTSARTLSAAQLQALEDTLHGIVGGKVEIDATVDPSLIGGLIVKVGSRMIDNSLRTKLQRLQLAMKGVG